MGTLVSILVGVAGAVSGALGTYLARRYRISSEAARTEQERVFAQYRRLVSGLEKHVQQLRGEVKELHKHYTDCRVENASLRARVADLEAHVKKLGSS